LVDLLFSSDWSWVEKYFEDLKLISSYKSSKTAAELRSTGNKHFQKKDFKVALQYYNQVVECTLSCKKIIRILTLCLFFCIFMAAMSFSREAK